MTLCALCGQPVTVLDEDGNGYVPATLDALRELVEAWVAAYAPNAAPGRDRYLAALERARELLEEA